MADYIPPALDWVREQVELYESSGGTQGNTLLDTGMPCILVTHIGNKTGGIRKIPLMRVEVDGNTHGVDALPPTLPARWYIEVGRIA